VHEELRDWGFDPIMQADGLNAGRSKHKRAHCSVLLLRVSVVFRVVIGRREVVAYRGICFL
jgi:hypothetical protein